MKEYDRVLLIKDKKEYKEHGVLKGMVGIIIEPRDTSDICFVLFDRFGEQPDIATIAVHEDDLRVIELLNRSAKEKDRVMLMTDKGHYASFGVYAGMNGLVISSEKINGQLLVQFGHFDNLPKLKDVKGCLPEIVEMLVEESDIKVYAPIDENGMEIEFDDTPCLNG